MGTVKPVVSDKGNPNGPMDIRKMSAKWNWSAEIDGKSIGGPYQLPMVVRQLEDRKIKSAKIVFDYTA